MKAVRISDADYPARLRHISSPPQTLYYEGEIPGMDKPAVAIVGSRACSSYGMEMAKIYAHYLASHGVYIISGMARGIDGEAQRSALLAGEKSFGVLACGVDICYPRSNYALYEGLIKQGGIVSEHPPGTQPLSVFFPSRNRIISGLANLVLVVEAKEKSGTGYTVRMALEQGREVYAIPGRVTDPMSKGCNRLIAEGAGMAECPEVVLEAANHAWQMEKMDEDVLNHTREISMAKKNARAHVQKAKREEYIIPALYERIKGLSGCEQNIITYLLQKERTVDELLDHFSQVYSSVSELLICLLQMEQKGYIENIGGFYFSKVV
ncbi:MAG: DNA-processing protein DprA [Lachnospiraceae bacterium]|nr:DNA-processing protein DprA [Lachnospiraceae bacterium]